MVMLKRKPSKIWDTLFYFSKARRCAYYVKDVELNSDIPIFAMTVERIVYYNRFNVIDQRETAMMDPR